ncbi:hypothetical protein DER29_2671 [Micromonospora sp. M71_S20]|uniref:DivIVA domain-containing protein n=1 Tax=Micromonospora sp. M71_S20 TaxID=592872 RepID=UPI000EAF5A82|nr:hypothetical protein [Micromonospora sp. M71_S20]RLK24740.1 hypothetical protein DER29_2671 [Micromonospora sp. M71_S20]
MAVSRHTALPALLRLALPCAARVSALTASGTVPERILVESYHDFLYSPLANAVQAASPGLTPDGCPMSVDHGDRVAADPHGETTRALPVLKARWVRGVQLDADEVAGVAGSADERLMFLSGEVDRLRRENELLTQRVESLRYGALPSAADRQGPDPIVVELAARALDEANRALGEASKEGAEIIAEARRQADEIIIEAHRRAEAVSAQLRQAVGG